MDAIILFSHGSVLCGAGETLFALARRMEARGDAPIVEVGFLNYSQPTFADAFETCVARGATRILIAPYFLVAGYFVKVSLPPVIEPMRAKYPAIAVAVADAMKTHSLLANAIINCAGRAFEPHKWRDLWDNAPQFCRPHPRCPLYDTPKCPLHPGDKPVPGADLEDAPIYSSHGATDPAALLVMVHGSPRPESNNAMFAVVEQVREREVFPLVNVGFMECNEPSIPDAIDELVGQGAKSVVAVPYFLHTGNHVADDLPTALEVAQRKYPNVKFSMGDYLGHDEVIADVLMDRVREVA